MTLAQALALLQPPPGHNTILSKEAIDVVCNAARLAPAVAQDGVTDKREQIKAAVERMRAEDKMLMSMLTFDESCELAEAAIAPLVAENARLRLALTATDVKLKLCRSRKAELAARVDRAEADANRLAEANERMREKLNAAVAMLDGVEVFVKTKERISHPTGAEWFDNERANLRAVLVEHNKLASG